ncbi:MAG: Holliday junction resolvase RuvX [Flavobacteriales bacterium]|nr:Holliday junction resolvase RuvX [Flavobacteriales bacterium]
MPKTIAIDFGLKRCGIAITDELQMIASPLETVESTALEDKLKLLVEKEQIDAIVIGLPLSLDGRDTHITENVRLLSVRLNLLYSNIEVILFDERFTSSMASAALVEFGVKKKDRQNKGVVDMTSAALILQGYLRNKQSNL